MAEIIPLVPSGNSKTDTQGNEPEGSITIENPDAPVNLDESIMPPAKTEDVYPPFKPGEKLPE